MAKHIIVGVCAGISAYKSAELVRLLCKAGYTVRVVMTESAKKFITPLTFEALTGNRVYSQLFDSNREAAMEHIELARWADSILVAPATADFMARLSCGIANDLLSTVCLASKASLCIVPAMNYQMWVHPATQDNLECLKLRGTGVIGPDSGSQACGDDGAGRMTEPRDIVEQFATWFESSQLLVGTRVLITAGPTQEPIDPVRYISNHSSGKMGYALAQSANDAGAQVTLISGPVAIPVPDVNQLIQVQTAEQMFHAVMNHLSDQNVFISCAAVSDYTPEYVSSSKLKKRADDMTVVFNKTQDILSTVALADQDIYCVGFAAETNDLEQYARAKLVDKKLDMIIANQVGVADRGFGGDNNEVSVLWKNGSKKYSLRSKKQLATDLVRLIAQQYANKN